MLSPDDRCVILEHLFDPDGLNSVLSDKLLLAYVTNDRKDLAQKVIENSERNGENELNLMGLRHKLNLGLAPKRNRNERLKIFHNFLNKPQEDPREVEFLHLMIDFCNEHYD